MRKLKIRSRRSLLLECKIKTLVNNCNKGLILVSLCGENGSHMLCHNFTICSNILPCVFDVKMLLCDNCSYRCKYFISLYLIFGGNTLLLFFLVEKHSLDYNKTCYS